jgi:hypothetical protein
MYLFSLNLDHHTHVCPLMCSFVSPHLFICIIICVFVVVVDQAKSTQQTGQQRMDRVAKDASLERQKAISKSSSSINESPGRQSKLTKNRRRLIMMNE